MPEEQEKSIIELGPAGGTTEITSPFGGGLPDLSHILSGTFVSEAERRKAALEALGMRRPRQKYKTTKQRKSAAKKRRKERREERTKALEQYGLAPKKRGKKLTPEQKKKKRAERGKSKRSLFREMARANPELAKQYGIDVNRFRL